eukprot:GILI01002469.1.p1 GENE.GILI01002469.1~~GILI01002469.1.p1  ORF type:complete len:294 (+),score=46.80 GILI01002469.1:211-1092(+)
MLRRGLPSKCPVAMAEDCIAAGSFHNALHYLTMVKSPSTARGLQQAQSPFVDYLRALCFLRLKEPLHARLALQEELRHTPSNEDAKDLLNRVNISLKESFMLPQSIIDSEPLFATIYEALRHHALLSWPRLFSIYCHAKELCEEGVAGDFVECGVASSSTFILAMVAKSLAPHRRVISCDAEMGEPLPAFAAEFGAEILQVKGNFEDTLPSLARKGIVRDIALLHLDCDWYHPTKAAITSLYPHVAQNGIIQIDDYNYWDGCKQAVREHFDKHMLSSSCLQNVDGNAVWFRKE